MMRFDDDNDDDDEDGGSKVHNDIMAKIMKIEEVRIIMISWWQ